jgi:prevent-host-death family protein
MRWKVSEAKQRFSDVVKSAAHEPQLIFNRNRLVAAIVDGETLKAFEDWRTAQERVTLADRFDELRVLIEKEDYDLAIPERRDRKNSMAENLDDIPS